MRGNGKRNEFGQTILTSDYGHDDLTRHRDDIPAPTTVRTPVRSAITRPEEAQMNTTTRTTRTAALIALLDADAPAKQVGTAAHALRVRQAHINPEVTRDMDILDDMEAAWLTDRFAVTVPLERLDDFRTWVHSRGMAPCGRGSYDVAAFDDQDVAWHEIIAAVR